MSAITPPAPGEPQGLLESSSPVAGDPATIKRISRGRLILRRFWRSKESKIGSIGLGLILLFAFVGPMLTPWKFSDVDSNAFLTGPDGNHWFGTTQGGRDVFAMTLVGLRKSLLIGLGVSLLIELMAALVGSIAAYFGKVTEKVILWVIDLLLVIPSFLMIAILAQHSKGNGGSLLLLILLLAAFGWMISARVVRAMTLSLVNLDYVTAAKYMSVPWYTTIVKHVLPNITSFLIIDFTLGISNTIMSETALSFFGFGVQAPDVSLGTLLQEGTPMATTYPWVFLAPAVVLTLSLIFINFLGDALRDAFDPTSKSGGKA